MLNKQAIKGYHYSRKGTPGNFLNFKKKDKDKVLLDYKKHTPDNDSDRYLRDRVKLETLLYATAKAKLDNKDMVKHPLYFRTDKIKEGWGTDVTKRQYTIDPELLDKATYSPGDSFDYLKKAKEKKTDLKQELKTLMTLDELKKKKKKIKTLDREHGNYIEGQLWAPYEIKGKKLVPLEKAAFNNINNKRKMTNMSTYFNNWLEKQAADSLEDRQNRIRFLRSTGIDGTRVTEKMIANAPLPQGWFDRANMAAGDMATNAGKWAGRQASSLGNWAYNKARTLDPTPNLTAGIRATSREADNGGKPLNAKPSFNPVAKNPAYTKPTIGLGRDIRR